MTLLVVLYLDVLAAKCLIDLGNIWLQPAIKRRYFAIGIWRRHKKDSMGSGICDSSVKDIERLAKRSQDINTTYRNIVGPAFSSFGETIAIFPHNKSQHFCTQHVACLATMLEHVATCSILKIELVRIPSCNIVARTWPSDYYIMQHPQKLHEKFDQV